MEKSMNNTNDELQVANPPEVSTERELFFAFGIPKSGTTYLQLILNSHPQVSCPSEHQFDVLLRNIPRLLQGYDQAMVTVDEKTARQGTVPFSEQDAAALCRAAILLAINRAAETKDAQWMGANDNAIVGHPALFVDLFPQAKFLCIVRDPRDSILSAWHHNLRVEPDFLQRAKSLEDWFDLRSRLWQQRMKNILELKEKKPLDESLLLVRYEDLLADGPQEMATIFNHLGAPTTPELIQQIQEQTSFDRVKKSAQSNSTDTNGFFRRGKSGSWRDELPPHCIEQVRKNAAEMMDFFDYS